MVLREVCQDESIMSHPHYSCLSHNPELLLSLKSMGDRHGVVIERYDFSDPQSSKDVCDRRIVSLKTHIRRWVNEGHNVTTAREMKVALESYGGVQGCHFAVVEVNNARVKKIPGISFLNNFQFVEDVVLSWKAYQIEKGHFYPYSSVVNNAQGDSAINVVVAFSSPSGSSGGDRTSLLFLWPVLPQHENVDLR